MISVFAACAPAQRDAPPPSAPAPAAAASQSSDAALPETLTISVLGLNDLHGRIGALPVFAGYVAIVRELRERDGGGVLLVDAGDIFQGTLESNLSEGESVMEAYRALDMDAAALGNHEFDFGPAGDAASGD